MLTGLQEPKKGGFEISLATDLKANGKNETSAVSLQPCVQQSEIICICND